MLCCCITSGQTHPLPPRAALFLELTTSTCVPPQRRPLEAKFFICTLELGYMYLHAKFELSISDVELQKLAAQIPGFMLG